MKTRFYSALVATAVLLTGMGSGRSMASPASAHGSSSGGATVSAYGGATSGAGSGTQYDFNLCGLTLPIVIKAIAVRDHNMRIDVLDSVPNIYPETCDFQGFTVDQVWYSVLHSYSLARVSVGGVTYVGVESDIARRFPGQGYTEGVFPYFGDPQGLSQISDALRKTLPDSAQVVAANGTITVVGFPDAVAQAQAFMSKVNDEASHTFAFDSKLIRLHNAISSDVVDKVTAALGTITPPDTFVEAKGENAVVASGTPEFVARAERVTEQFDVKVPMVRFDVTVVALSPNNDNSDAGVEWGGIDATGTQIPGSGSTVVGIYGRKILVNARLNLLLQKGQAQVITRGALYATSGKESQINGQTEIPVLIPAAFGGQATITPFYTGALIDAIPTLTDQGAVVALDAKYNTLQGYTLSSPPVPIISTNEAKGYLTLQPDYALVLAGFYTDESTVSEQKVPLLGNLPVLGWLFKNQTTSKVKQEVDFVIVPHFGTDPDLTPQGAVPIGRPPLLDLCKPIFQQTYPSVQAWDTPQGRTYPSPAASPTPAPGCANR